MEETIKSAEKVHRITTSFLNELTNTIEAEELSLVEVMAVASNFARGIIDSVAESSETSADKIRGLFIAALEISDYSLSDDGPTLKEYIDKWKRERDELLKQQKNRKHS